MTFRATMTWVWLVLGASVGVGLFVLKHEVQTLESQLINLNASIRNDRRAVHVLNAEWNHLTDPARLRKLSEKHMSLRPIRPDQVTTISALPFRPPPVPDRKPSERGPELASAETEK